MTGQWAQSPGNDPLAGDLQRVWNDPDGLETVIVGALDAGRSADVVPAVRRLHDIDHDPVRAANLHALVLRTCADHAGAERVLLDHLKKHGGDAQSWFNLAPLAAWRGSPNDVDVAIGNALKYDLNHAQALDWGLRYHQREHGDEAALRWLWNHAYGSWRAHVMLGHEVLRWGDPSRAMEFFEAGCELAPHEPQMLASAARSLFEHGRHAELVDLVLRRWRGSHGAVPLMYVVDSQLILDNPADAAMAMSRLRGVPVPEHLTEASAELERRVQEAIDRAGI